MANLVQRNGLWYAEVRVPRDVKNIIGKSVLRRSTKHRQKRNAELAAAPWIANWWELINQARSEPDAVLVKIESLLLQWKDQEARGNYYDYEYQYDSAGQQIGGGIGTTEAEFALSDYWEDLQYSLPPAEFAYYREIYKDGSRGLPLGFYLNQFISEHYTDTAPRTRQEVKNTIRDAAEYFPSLIDLTVSRRRKWLMEQRGAAKTISKRISHLRSYFLWLRDNEKITSDTANPFVHGEIKLPRRLAQSESYLPFVPYEITELRSSANARGDAELVKYIDIATWTGMRISEVAQISKYSIVNVDNVQCLRVRRDAKNATSSNRLVPLVKPLLSLVDIASLEPAVKDPNGVNVGLRFTRLKQAMGHGSSKVFHSIRKTVATAFEHSGVSEGVAADILGHKKKTMTYGVYSGGTSVAQRQLAMEAMEQRLLLEL